jgi:hypothetical protein
MVKDQGYGHFNGEIILYVVNMLHSLEKLLAIMIP